jgi:hypothetical protein
LPFVVLHSLYFHVFIFLNPFARPLHFPTCDISRIPWPPPLSLAPVTAIDYILSGQAKRQSGHWQNKSMAKAVVEVVVIDRSFPFLASTSLSVRIIPEGVRERERERESDVSGGKRNRRKEKGNTTTKVCDGGRS